MDIEQANKDIGMRDVFIEHVGPYHWVKVTVCGDCEFEILSALEAYTSRLRLRLTPDKEGA